jgi:hypothetical protein
MKYRVKIIVSKSRIVEVEAKSVIDAEDEAVAMYYKGALPMPEGSPSLDAHVLDKDGKRES